MKILIIYIAGSLTAQKNAYLDYYSKISNALTLTPYNYPKQTTHFIRSYDIDQTYNTFLHTIFNVHFFYFSDFESTRRQ